MTNLLIVITAIATNNIRVPVWDADKMHQTNIITSRVDMRLSDGTWITNTITKTNVVLLRLKWVEQKEK